MLRRIMQLGVLLAVVVCVHAATSQTARATEPPLPRFHYYPYYYFPHSYWPTQSPKWPEAPGMPYMRPPAYMAYPAFHEPYWRYELWSKKPYYRGNHFWLDQF